MKFDVVRHKHANAVLNSRIACALMASLAAWPCPHGSPGSSSTSTSGLAAEQRAHATCRRLRSPPVEAWRTSRGQSSPMPSVAAQRAISGGADQSSRNSLEISLARACHSCSACTDERGRGRTD